MDRVAILANPRIIGTSNEGSQIMQLENIIDTIYDDLADSLGDEFINATIETKTFYIRSEFESILADWLDAKRT